MTGAYVSFIESTGLIGFFGFAIVQVVLAVALGARIMKIKHRPPVSCSTCTRR